MNTQESEKRLKISKEIVNGLEKHKSTPLRCFIVYGSTTLGTAHAKSDIDIMILVDFHRKEFLNQLKATVDISQNTYNIPINLNLKKVSDFLKEITEGNHYFLHISLKGRCLLDSKVFKGFQSIVAANKLPTKEDLIRKNAKDTHERVKQLFLGSLVKLSTGIRITILKYLDLQLVDTMKLESWDEYQNIIQRNAYEPTIRTYLPQYADNIMAFFALSDQIKPMGFDLDALDKLAPCNFGELLQCIEYIKKNSQLESKS